MKKVWSGLVVLIAICWVITGCQQSSASSGTVEQKLVIEKYIADNQYGHAVKMKDQNQVQKVQQWLKDVSWREEKAEMVRKPNYIIHFEPVETKKDIKVQSYRMWVNFGNETVELATDTHYAQLKGKQARSFIELVEPK